MKKEILIAIIAILAAAVLIPATANAKRPDQGSIETPGHVVVDGNGTLVPDANQNGQGGDADDDPGEDGGGDGGATTTCRQPTTTEEDPLPDSDDDGAPDYCDNCLYIANPNQAVSTQTSSKAMKLYVETAGAQKAAATDEIAGGAACDGDRFKGAPEDDEEGDDSTDKDEDNGGNEDVYTPPRATLDEGGCALVPVAGMSAALGLFLSLAVPIIGTTIRRRKK